MEYEVLAQLGGTVVIAALFGAVLLKIYRINAAERAASEARMSEIIKSDQSSRERNTEALTQLTSSIKQLSGSTLQGTRDCNLIREAFAVQVDNLNRQSTMMKEIVKGVLQIAKKDGG